MSAAPETIFANRLGEWDLQSGQKFPTKYIRADIAESEKRMAQWKAVSKTQSGSAIARIKERIQAKIDLTTDDGDFYSCLEIIEEETSGESV